MGSLFRRARASQDNGKPIFQLFCSTDPHGDNTRFKLFPFYSHGLLLCVRRHCLCLCAVCVLRVRVCGSVHLCAGTPHSSFCILALLAAAAAAAAMLLYHVCITPSLKLSSSLLCGSHGTTAIAHRALPFVTATDGASVCVRVHAMFPIGTNIKSQERCKDAAQGAGQYKPPLTCSGFQKQARSHDGYNSSTSASNSGHF